jgi:hypothetical protein
LLASGNSSSMTLAKVLAKVDRILLEKLQEHLKRAVKAEKSLLEMKEIHFGGFMAASVCTLLSGYALQKLVDINTPSLYHSVELVDNTDEMHIRTWLVTDRRFGRAGSVHRVTQIREQALPDIDHSVAECIRANLSRNVDLGRDLCAQCGQNQPADM